MLELFTVGINDKGSIDLHFKRDLLQVVDEAELINLLSLEQQEQIIEIALTIVNKVKGVE